MMRRLKRAIGIHFSTKALARNPGVHLRQMFRRHRSFRDLLDRLADARPIAVVQVGANDGTDPLGDLIRDRPDRIDRALLIEPQRAAFARLTRRFEDFPQVIRLNVAIDRQAGERQLYSIRSNAGVPVGDGIASFDRQHVERVIRTRTDADSCSGVPALIATETVPATTLYAAADDAGVTRPDVLMVDTEGFDGEVVHMAFQAGWLPAIIRYEHKHLTQVERRVLGRELRQRGYSLWADHADVWGLRFGAFLSHRAGPELSRPLVLSGLEPFAKGGFRHCYVHPDDADLSVKVVARAEDPRCHAEQRWEVADCRWLKKHWSSTMSDRIPAFEGFVETDRGVGIVMRLCRDFDGRVSLDLARLIREHGLTPALDQAVDELKLWLREQRLLTRDASPKNVVAVRMGGGDWKLMIIEGWRHRRWRWLAQLHPVVADWLIRKQMRKFDRRLAMLTGTVADAAAGGAEGGAATKERPTT